MTLHHFITQMALVKAINSSDHAMVRSCAMAIFNEWPDDSETGLDVYPNLELAPRRYLLDLARHFFVYGGWTWDENPKHGLKITDPDGNYRSSGTDLSVMP